jgi:Ca2+-binding EF-hand superfamily protein
MSPEEVLALRNDFVELDRDGTGMVSLAEFTAAMARGGPARSPAAGDEKGLMTEALMTEADCAALFRQLDRNQTGALDYSEFLAAALDPQRYLDEARIRQAFDLLDADRSGHITVENVESVLGTKFSHAEVEAMIDEADLTRDGAVGYEEFLSIMRGGEKPKAGRGGAAGTGAGTREARDADDGGTAKRAGVVRGVLTSPRAADRLFELRTPGPDATVTGARAPDRRDRGAGPAAKRCLAMGAPAEGAPAEGAPAAKAADGQPSAGGGGAAEGKGGGAFGTQDPGARASATDAPDEVRGANVVKPS